MTEPRWLAVWRRNLRVWTRMAVPSILANFGEPVLYLLALGLGLGSLIGEIDGLPYLVFLASGIVCSSTMNTASFEGLYSAYTRMEIQRTWEAILAAPLNVSDIVLGETVWGATKAMFSATAILAVAAALGTVADWRALGVLPVLFLTGLAFTSMALMVTAFARSYDFFLYYITLLITPMLLLSGVFFPIGDLPAGIQEFARALPLHHAVALTRPLMTGQPLSNPLFHIVSLGLYGLAAGSAAAWLLTRRLRR